MSALQRSPRDVPPVAAEVEIISPMSAEENADLARLERRMRANIQGFHEFIADLTEILDRKLYRDRYASFEEYCAERWKMSRAHGYRHVVTHRIIADLAGATVLPMNESQARPLQPLPAPLRREAWDAAVQGAGGKTPTQKQVREAVARIAPETAPAPAPRRAPEPPVRVDYGPKLSAADKKVMADVVPEGVQVVEVVAAPLPVPDAPAVTPAYLMSPEEIVESCPALADLPDATAARFRADALLFLEAGPLRDAFREGWKPLKAAALKAGKSHIGPHMAAVTRFLEAADPRHWKACQPCQGTGAVELLGKCPECRGHGYTIR